MKTILLLIALSLFALSVNAYSQNWQTVGVNNQRNGLSKIVGPDSVINPVWTVNSLTSLWGNSVFYFYKLHIIDPEISSGQGFIETKKMILLR